jgi:CRP/FNR family transcriptional regulator, cyclic AMP receptor protein
VKTEEPNRKRIAPAKISEVEKILNQPGVRRSFANFKAKQIIHTQGDACVEVFYILKGAVRLSLSNARGKEAVVALLHEGDFFGEGCLAGQPQRIATATAVSACSVITVEKQEMARLLHSESAFSDRFIGHMLSRNIRIEEDLVDQLFNSSEKRLARALLLLAQYGKEDQPKKKLPKVSQELLAEMVGTTRSRISFFMNKFRKLGMIEYDGGSIEIDRSLLSVVLNEQD